MATRILYTVIDHARQKAIDTFDLRAIAKMIPEEGHVTLAIVSRKVVEVPPDREPLQTLNFED